MFIGGLCRINTRIALLRILMMVNGDYGEREHAPALQTLDAGFYSPAFMFVKGFSFLRIDSPFNSIR